MLLFIIIFFAMVIVAAAAATAGFSIYLKRRAKSLESADQKQFAASPPYRSLFEPDEAEIRALAEHEARSQIEADRQKAEQWRLSENAARISEFEQIWNAAPTKQNAVELLRLATASESAEIFSQTAENIMRHWHEHKIENLTSTDLADLLDSHLQILPQQERFSGAIFWLRKEIGMLRGKSK